MSLWGTLILGWFVLLAILRLILASRLIRSFSKSAQSETEIEDWPTVMVIMALRGGDDSLEETLTRLMSLDYPNYYVRFVIDSQNDPVAKVVQHAVSNSRHPQTEVLYLPERKRTCSGKISSLLYASEELPIHCEVVAIFDGDAILHSTCLKEMVIPLQEGATLTTGNRWYCPPATFGGMIRFIWSGFAMTMMNSLRVPWGGCIAMHADVFQNPTLKQRLEGAFGEDSMISTFLSEQKQQIEFVPSATILNYEDTSLKSFYNFLMRQYLSMRLNSNHWGRVSVIAATIGFTAVTANAWLVLGGPYWWEMLCGYLIFIGSLIVEIQVGSFLVRRLKRRQGIELPRLTLKHWFVAPIALISLNYTNLLAIFHALLIRKHLWRGVTYRFPGQKRCEIIDVQDLSLPVAEEAVALAVNAEA